MRRPSSHPATTTAPPATPLAEGEALLRAVAKALARAAAREAFAAAARATEVTGAEGSGQASSHS